MSAHPVHSEYQFESKDTLYGWPLDLLRVNPKGGFVIYYWQVVSNLLLLVIILSMICILLEYRIRLKNKISSS